MPSHWTSMHSVHFHNLGVNPGHDIEQDNPQSHSSDQTAYLQPSTSEVTDLPIQDPSWQHGSRFTNIQPGVSDDTLGPLLSPGRTTFPASEFQTVQSSTSSNPSWTPNTILPFSPQHILDLTPVRSIPATPHLYEGMPLVHISALSLWLFARAIIVPARIVCQPFLSHPYSLIIKPAHPLVLYLRICALLSSARSVPDLWALREPCPSVCWGRHLQLMLTL
ncbi:hypothetical protein F5148DRAFT_69862 [Russula earlei]|uniref:Uncharacterized protein n=1 Tax=Russula earlei TaxID=71964 RepID=A0ACC0U7V3_9AGAM|nr:hypothetical protein F5148DRAFT_69862 [Russula earlei]